MDLYLNAALDSLFRKLTGVFLRNRSLDNVIFSQLGSIFRRSMTENENFASASAAADFFSLLDVGDKEKFCSQTLQKRHDVFVVMTVSVSLYNTSDLSVGLIGELFQLGEIIFQPVEMYFSPGSFQKSLHYMLSPLKMRIFL